ncbi:Tim44-like domain family protein [Candidatus Kinetoplastibacterium galatii TCC219]|uniref:Tim44-like domain family protein n=2 Tax=Candidatus Kinetoplastidibacterium galati TaxID=994695 RepID=M1LTD2_9PROT|nr:Tim44-like domain family protein [Candidatus Kinetoplastibacterium galatii TCC219]
MSLSCHVEARRIGGGHSIGKQYKTPCKKNYSNSNNSSYKNESKKSLNNSNRDSLFSRIIGPMIAGFGLATILSYFGMSSFFVNFVSILIVFFLILSSTYLVFSYLFMKNSRFNYCRKQRDIYDSNCTYFNNDIERNISDDRNLSGNFNIKEFSEQAKGFFLHMQELWKNGDINSLNIYLTEEMIRNIENDFKCKNYNREVQVLSLYSEFLNIDNENSDGNIMANIRFFGVVKEDDNSDVSSFDEIWIFQKGNSSGWILAGIQKNIDD